MLIEHPFPWHYVTTSLSASPVVIRQLIHGISPDEADWRPDADRLTVREIIPHLAGWDPVILGHMRRICKEEVPFLPDEDHDYAPMTTGVDPSDLLGQCDFFEMVRGETLSFLRERKPEEWTRQAIRSKYGSTTLEAQTMLIILHDIYHLKQIAEVRQKYDLKFDRSRSVQQGNVL